jgi:DNA-binding transcriptional regulator YhcF (GntR family)
MKLYMCVTKDEYELPIAVADTQAELARMLGVRLNTVNRAYHCLRSGKYKDSQYKEIEIEEGDGNELVE